MVWLKVNIIKGISPITSLPLFFSCLALEFLLPYMLARSRAFGSDFGKSAYGFVGSTSIIYGFVKHLLLFRY